MSFNWPDNLIVLGDVEMRPHIVFEPEFKMYWVITKCEI